MSETQCPTCQRDDCECQVCGRGEAEIGREPDVHHIRPFRKFGREDHEEANALDKLVTLCPEHHRQVEKGVVSLEGYER
jgi:5-methylcytosine-specific restriction endonuclease McrA